MIFLNNSGGLNSSRGGSRYTCRRVGAQFGSISRNSHHHDHSEDQDSLNLTFLVASFGLAITLGLVLLPLTICCSSTVISHPLFVTGVVVFVILVVFGVIFSGFHAGVLSFRSCWWYKNQEDGCCILCRKRRNSPEHQPRRSRLASAATNEVLRGSNLEGTQEEVGSDHCHISNHQHHNSEQFEEILATQHQQQQFEEESIFIAPIATADRKDTSLV